MLTPLESLDAAELLGAVAEQYSGADARIEFQPVGEDSWAYASGRLWISVRRDLRGHVPAAYEGAWELRHRAGHDFVLAPLRGADGATARRLAGHAVVVFPRVEVVSFEARRASPGELRTAFEHVRMVHASTVAADLPCEDYRLSFEADLELADSMAQSGGAVQGPLSTRLFELLAAHRSTLDQLRDELARLAARCIQARGAPALTHGEPILSNVYRDGRGSVLIGDWGELALAPPERDLSHLRRVTGLEVPGREEFMRFYDLRWVLSEIAEYVSVLAAPHAGTADDQAMWDRLTRYLPEPTRAAR